MKVKNKLQTKSIMKKTFVILCGLMVSMASMAQTPTSEITKMTAEQLAPLVKSAKTEAELIAATNRYNSLGDKVKVAEMQELILKKYPNGTMARSKSLNELYDQKTGADQEKYYKTWIKRFSPEKMGANIAYDYAAYSVAYAYAGEGNGAKAVEYISKAVDPAWASNGMLSVMQALEQNGCPTEAAQLLDLALERANKALQNPNLSSYEKQMQSEVFRAYAHRLYAQGKKKEAMAEYEKMPASMHDDIYARLLADNGRTMEAFVMLDQKLREGRNTKDTDEALKAVWQKGNGSLEGLDAHISLIKAQHKQKVKDEVAKSMIQEKAPDFAIKDINGNVVRLSDLKGKTVILDFWATWCGPCKRSLPAMKMTVEKYKADPDVVFLFAHTWERGTVEEAYKDAKEYLDTNGYGDFHLLMDTKDPETKVCKAVTAYGVQGIPAKFIIDGQGDIRFKISGFGGSDEDAVTELSEMIELCKKK